MNIINDDSILYEIKCKDCNSILSIPFEFENIINSERIVLLERYKGIGINFYSESCFDAEEGFVYSEVFCAKCNLKLGYWIIKGNNKYIKSVNKICIYQNCVEIITVRKKDIDEIIMKKNKQKEIFYSSNIFNSEVIKYGHDKLNDCIYNCEIFFKKIKEVENLLNQDIDMKIKKFRKLLIYNISHPNNKIKLNIAFNRNSFSFDSLINKNIKNKKEVNNIKTVEKNKSFEEDDKIIKEENKNDEKEVEINTEFREKKSDVAINKSTSTSDIYINNKEPNKNDKKRKNNKRKATNKSRGKKKK